MYMQKQPLKHTTPFELKTDEACDLTACTQVYVRVDYEGGYNSPGELNSTNLLSDKAVQSIGSFDYKQRPRLFPQESA